ncbi:MAG: hypothetical protein KJ630_19155 [Proteobacteria bacterium]|nr:hypothetical protein [Pseudomonadota bacterium]
MAGTFVYTAGSLTKGSEFVGELIAKYPAVFTDDASTADDIPDCDIATSGGHLSGVGVVFGTTAPDTVTITVKDSDGMTLASGTLTATGRLESFAPAPFVGALTVSVSGNSTLSATGTVILYAF